MFIIVCMQGSHCLCRLTLLVFSSCGWKQGQCMTRSDLVDNFIDNSKAIPRRSHTWTTSSHTTSPATSPPPTDDLIQPAPSATTAMAKTLRKYSIPDVANVPTDPAVDTGNRNFELRTGLITMVYANQWNWFAKKECKCTSPTCPRALQHHSHERHHTCKHKALSVSLSPCGKNETMVLQGKGSCQHMDQMFRGVPRQVLPHEQNQCPEGKNFQLPAEHHSVNSRGTGKTTRLHPSMPTPWHRRLVSDPIFLWWANPDV